MKLRYDLIFFARKNVTFNKNLYIMVEGNSIHIVGILGEDYRYSNLIDDLNEYGISRRKNIHIGIDSPGGYVDEAMLIYDKLTELGKSYTISTYNIGDVMSAATLIFLTGQNRTFDFSKGNFVAHNPYVQIEGDAATLRQYAKELQKTEDMFTNIYSKVSKVNQAEISEIMDENRPLTFDEMLRLKLATEIKNGELAPNVSFAEYVAQPFAALSKDIKIDTERNIELNNQNNNIKMKVIEKIKALLKVSEIKSLVVTSADGIDYQVSNEDGSEDLKVGSAVTIEGQPYDGEIILPDDTVITVEGGIVTKIEQPEKEVEEQPEAKSEEQKSEETPSEETPAEEETKENTDAIDSLRGKVDELFALLNDLTERVNKIEGGKNEEVENLKAQIKGMVSSERPNTVNDTPSEEKCMFGFKK